jgi:hypothetical protein
VADSPTQHIGLTIPTVSSRIYIYFEKNRTEMINYVTDVCEKVVISSGVMDKSIMNRKIFKFCCIMK